MVEFAFATGWSVTDFAYRLGLRQLAEHHRNKLAPAAEAFGRFFCTALLFVSSFLERFLDRSHTCPK
jgi:hypothetical protein